MKVLQLLPSLNIGGVERGVVEMSRRLSARGIDSIVAAKGGVLAQDIVDDGGRFVALDCASKTIFGMTKRIQQLRALLMQESPDIIHIRSRIPGWMLYFARGRDVCPHAKIVSTIHGIYHPGFYSAIMTKADAVICPSNAVWHYARKHYRVAEDKLHIIHRGIDFDYFDPQKTDMDFCAAFRKRYQLTNKPVALIAARLTQLKGHELFVRALAAHDDVIGLIVGGGSEKRQRRLMQLADNIGVGERLIFAGAQTNMREIYAIADITVSASTRPEAFGRTVAESLAMNTPVVACAHGGALDIVDDGVNGCLFAPGDVDELADSIGRGLLLNEGLRESVLPMSLDGMFDKTLAVYQSVINRQSISA